jgi:hypothetical protein
MVRLADKLNAPFSKYPYRWDALAVSSLRLLRWHKLRGGRHASWLPSLTSKGLVGPQPTTFTSQRDICDRNRKAESHWGKRKAVEESGKLLRKAEIRWRKRKAVEESRKAVEENGISEGKILIFPERFSSIWQFLRLVFLCDLLVFLRNLPPRVLHGFTLALDPLTKSQKLTLLVLCAWFLHSRLTTTQIRALAHD